MAVYASIDLFDFSAADKKTEKRLTLPKGKKRLFRKYDFGENADITIMMHVYAPAIRDTSLFN